MSVAALSFTVVANLGCADYGLDRYHPTTADPTEASFTLPVTDLTVETSSTAAVSGGAFKLTSTGTADYGCTNTGAATATTGAAWSVPEYLTDQTHRQAAFITTPSAMNISGIKLRMKRLGGPSGTMYAVLKTASSGVPTATTLATSTAVNLSSATTGGTLGPVLNYPFASAVDVATASELALVLTPDAAASLTTNNKVGMNGTNDGTGAACSAFPIYKFSLDSGSNWIDSANNSTYRTYSTMTVTTYNSSGTAYWSVHAAKSVSWNMSSFTVSEKPNSMGGTITYDIGSAEDSTPVFTQNGLSLAQVQALTGIAGEYLFIRVNLASTTPFYERAEVGAAAISNY